MASSQKPDGTFFINGNSSKRARAIVKYGFIFVEQSACIEGTYLRVFCEYCREFQGVACSVGFNVQRNTVGVIHNHLAARIINHKCKESNNG